MTFELVTRFIVVLHVPFVVSSVGVDAVCVVCAGSRCVSVLDTLERSGRAVIMSGVRRSLHPLAGGVLLSVSSLLLHPRPRAAVLRVRVLLHLHGRLQHHMSLVSVEAEALALDAVCAVALVGLGSGAVISRGRSIRFSIVHVFAEGRGASRGPRAAVLQNVEVQRLVGAVGPFALVLDAVFAQERVVSVTVRHTERNLSHSCSQGHTRTPERIGSYL